jgi:hypothetical protein
VAAHLPGRSTLRKRSLRETTHKQNYGRDEFQQDRDCPAVTWRRQRWPVSPLWRYALGEGRRIVITRAKPISVNASGIGHHQCSQNAATPCALSRPTQKMPSTRESPPTTRPIRRVIRCMA